MKRYAHSSVQIGDRMAVIGGLRAENEYEYTVSMYSYACDTWHTIGRFWAHSCMIGAWLNHIHVAQSFHWSSTEKSDFISPFLARQKILGHSFFYLCFCKFARVKVRAFNVGHQNLWVLFFGKPEKPLPGTNLMLKVVWLRSPQLWIIRAATINRCSRCEKLGILTRPCASIGHVTLRPASSIIRCNHPCW